MAVDIAQCRNNVEEMEIMLDNVILKRAGMLYPDYSIARCR